MNRYSSIEPYVLEIFEKYGIIFTTHRYSYTSEYYCNQGRLKFNCTGNDFYSNSEFYDKKAEMIMNEIKHILPKYGEFHWFGNNGKTLSVRNV